MAQTATLFRFAVQLSDVERGIYTPIEIRLPRHPSESTPFFLTRVIAYLLNYQEGITFSGGIDTPDEPAIAVRDLTGAMLVWSDVGNPSAKRLHKASKASKKVRIYTYRDPKILLDEIASEKIYAVRSLEIFALSPGFIAELEPTVQRQNTWECLYSAGELSITSNGVSVQGDLRSIPVE